LQNEKLEMLNVHQTIKGTILELSRKANLLAFQDFIKTIVGSILPCEIYDSFHM